MLDFGSVGAVDCDAIDLVQRQWWGVGCLRVIRDGTVAGFTGVVGGVGAVDRHSSPPSVGTQFRIRLTLGNGSGPGPVQVPVRTWRAASRQTARASSALDWAEMGAALRVACPLYGCLPPDQREARDRSE